VRVVYLALVGGFIGCSAQAEVLERQSVERGNFTATLVVPVPPGWSVEREPGSYLVATRMPSGNQCGMHISNINYEMVRQTKLNVALQNHVAANLGRPGLRPLGVDPAMTVTNGGGTQILFSQATVQIAGPTPFTQHWVMFVAESNPNQIVGGRVSGLYSCSDPQDDKMAFPQAIGAIENTVISVTQNAPSPPVAGGGGSRPYSPYAPGGEIAVGHALFGSGY
jgi:hypothetical protein